MDYVESPVIPMKNVTNNGLSFNIEPVKPVPQKKQTINTETLVLKHFSAVPKLSFDNVKIGTKKTVYLRLENPNDDFVSVSLKKFPYDKGFDIDCSAFNVDSHGNYIVAITWTPIEDGNIRQTVQVETNLNLRLQIILLGSAKNAKPTNKRRSKFGTTKENKIQRRSVNCTKSTAQVSKKKLSSCDRNGVTTFCETYSKSSNQIPLKEINKTSNVEPPPMFGHKVINPATDFPHTPIRRQTYCVKDVTATIEEIVTNDETYEVKTALFGKQFPGIKNEIFEDSLDNSVAFDDSLEIENVEVVETVQETVETMKHFRKRWVIESTEILDSLLIGPKENNIKSDEQVIDHSFGVKSDTFELKTNYSNASANFFDIEACDDRRCSTGIRSKPPALESLEDISIVDGLSKELFVQKSPQVDARLSTETFTMSPPMRANGIDSCDAQEIGDCAVEIQQMPVIDNERTVGFVKSPRKKFKPVKVVKCRRSPVKSPRKPRVQKANVSVKTGVRSPNKTVKLRRQAALQKSASLQSTTISIKKPTLGLAQKKLTMVRKVKHQSKLTHHPNPYAAKNMFYDEKWIEKQERGFTRWLNFFLTPPEDLSTSGHVAKVDAGKLWIEYSKKSNNAPVEKAPTKEDLSLKAYTAKRNLNRLRKAACILFQSEPVAAVIGRIEAEIEKGRIVVRSDRALHADFGIKQQILDMLLGYNSLWLRIGLETVYGEILPLESNSDVLGISRFIIQRLLNCPVICSEYAHPTVPHLYRPGFEQAIKNFTLKKFLLLVYFLDRAKLTRLIDHDPCLFCCDAKFKSSRDLLLVFSRDFLKGEGDLTKHLSYLGYVVSHEQKYLDEFNYAVENISVDLRCGVRLMKVTSLLLQNWTLLQEARVPAISKLQKVHNIGVVFKTLENYCMKISGGITSKDICEGHREKTLGLLWQLIFKFQIEVILNKAKLREEIGFLNRSLKAKSKLKDLKNLKEPVEKNCLNVTMDLYFNSESLQLLLQWCQAVCAHYNLTVENFTVSFSDGRALCYLIHHYHPSLLPLAAIMQETTQTQKFASLDDSSSDDSLHDKWKKTYSPTCGKPIMAQYLANERKNFKLAFEKLEELGSVPLLARSVDMSNTIPDEKVVITLLSYLNVRLMDLSTEIRACRTIQLAWKHYRIKKYNLRRQALLKYAVILQRAYQARKLRQAFIKMRQSAVIIQAWFKGVKAKAEYSRMQNACRAIESFWIAKKLCVDDRKAFLAQKRAAIKFQSLYRGFIARRHYLRMQGAAVAVQSCLRCYLARERFLKIKGSCAKIEKWYLSVKDGRRQRCEFLLMKSSAVSIQAAFRSLKARRVFIRQRRAVVVMQSIVRGYLTRLSYRRQQNAAVVIQQYYRLSREMSAERNHFLTVKSSALTIQRSFRAWVVRRQYLQTRSKIVMIQASFRAWSARSRFLRRKQATNVIVRHWRAKMQGQAQRKAYIAARCSAIKIQSWYRSQRAQQLYMQQKNAAIVIQANLRCHFAQVNYLKIKIAASKIENWYLSWKSASSYRLRYLNMRKSTVVIQNAFRGFKARAEYQRCRTAAIVLQSATRGYFARRQYRKQRSAVIFVQKMYRSKLATRRQQSNFLTMRSSAILIQSAFRVLKIRRQYLSLQKAAICIQRAFRAYKQRQEYLKLRQSAVAIQKFWRDYRHGCHIRDQYLILRSNIVVIQSRWRQILAVRQVKYIKSIIKIQSYCRRYLVQKQIKIESSSAVKIQSWWRMVRLRQKYATMKSSAVLIQRRYRNFLIGRRAQQQFNEAKTAAILIQSTARMFIAKKRFADMKHSAIRIQSFYRMFVQRQQYICQRKSAVVLQSWYRALKSGRQQYLTYHIQRGAAIYIQAWARMLAARRQYVQQKSAAIVIQANTRRALAMRKYQTILSAVKVIQDRYRATRLAYDCMIDYHKTRGAAICIQAWYRKCVCQQRYKTQKAACVLIQSHVRRVIVQYSYKAKLQAARTIQERYRAVRLGAACRVEYAKKVNAAICLQSWFRACAERRRFETKKTACILVQSHVRRIAAERKYRAQLHAAWTIQRWYRAVVMRNQAVAAYLHCQHAILTIQSAIRGFLVRRTIRKLNGEATKIQRWLKTIYQRRSFCLQRQSAVTIQRCFRGHVKRKALQHQYQQTKSSIIKVQSVIRGFVARQQVKKQLYYIVMLQAMVRATLARKRYLDFKQKVQVLQKKYRALMLMRRVRYEYQAKKSACVCLQSHVRGYQAREWYVKQRHLVVVLQACVRRYHARKVACRRLEAIRTLQMYLRSYLDMKMCREHFQRVKDSAVIIQSAFRAYQARNLLRKQKTAVKIQSALKMMIARRKYVTYRKNIITVQSYVRRRLAVKHIRHIQHRHQAAQKIQNCYRQYCTQKRIREERKMREELVERFTAAAYFNLKAIAIQRCYRNAQIRHQAKKQLQSVVVIQTWMRAKLERLRYLKMRNGFEMLQRVYKQRLDMKHKSAVVIQACVRSFLARKYALKWKQSIIVVQAHWRSYKVRKTNKSKKLTMIRKRLKEATRNATEGMKLYQRTKCALDYLLECKSITTIIAALQHLDVVTSLSAACCIKMAESNAVHTIFRLIQSCNRSLPHMDVIKYSINVLLNLAKYNKTVDSVRGVECSAETLLELMSIFREKGETIFTKCCTLLWIMIQDETYATSFKSNGKYAEKVKSLHYLVQRKSKLKRQNSKPTLSGPILNTTKNSQKSTLKKKTSGVQLKVQPDWVLGKHFREFEDSMVSISSVAKQLNVV